LFLFPSCGSGQPPKQPDTTPGKNGAASGADIYNRTCIACHQGSGEGAGTAFPPLAKSDFLLDKERTIRQVIKGASGDMTVNGKNYNNAMPPQQLSDDEVAAVLTYVYSSFGNSGGTVTASEVKAIRDKQ
jgi:nitrite reductase (NO-forming)